MMYIKATKWMIWYCTARLKLWILGSEQAREEAQETEPKLLSVLGERIVGRWIKSADVECDRVWVVYMEISGFQPTFGEIIVSVSVG